MERRAQIASFTSETSALRSRPWAEGGEDPFSSALLGELREGSREQRRRAAARLEAILGLEALPHLCEALSTEEDPEVLAAVCASLGRLGEASALDSLRPLLDSEEPGVRSAALEACLRLSDSEAERMALIEGGLGDPSGSVRRRTFLAAAALSGMELAPYAIRFRRDEDPHLRRLAYVALATHTDPSLASMALDALLDPDPGVRTAAVTALERWFGDSIRALGEASPLEVRREIAALKSRLAGGQPSPRAASKPEKEGGEAPRSAAADSEPAVEAESTADAGEVDRADETRAAPIAFEAIQRVLLAAIRGMHLGDLAAELGEEEAKVGAAVQQYLIEGRLVLRGTKLYLP